MKDKKIVYAIIPARGNSKQIPGKNLKEFCGKPLVIWTIEEVLEVKDIDHVIISSNDQNILNIGESYGIGTHKRSEKLCEDDVPGWKVASDLMRVTKAPKDSTVIYLQPTSPLRTAKDIRVGLLTFRVFDCDSVISGYQNNKLFYGFKILNQFLEPLFYKAHLSSRRQDLPDAFMLNGAVYVISYENLDLYESFYTPRTKAYLMPKERSVDLDSLEEWLFAEFLMRARLFKENDMSL
jgi:CMP-N-acetylneuraminic acid synthetase